MSTTSVIILYVLIALIVFGVEVYFFDEKDEFDLFMMALISIFWPFFLCAIIVMLPFFAIYKLAKALKKYKHRKKIELTFK